MLDHLVSAVTGGEQQDVCGRRPFLARCLWERRAKGVRDAGSWCHTHAHMAKWRAACVELLVLFSCPQIYFIVVQRDTAASAAEMDGDFLLLSSASSVEDLGGGGGGGEDLSSSHAPSCSSEPVAVESGPADDALSA